MGVFDDLLVIENNGKVLNNEWIKWVHVLIPDSPAELRDMLRSIMVFLGHCPSCTSLSGCYFAKRNRQKYPMHIKCDCIIKIIPYSTVKAKAKAECSIEKFTNYIFREGNSKKALFEAMGYSIQDAQSLKNYYEREALSAYLNGNYILKEVDQYGQRLAIEIKLGDYIINTGWKLEPNGKLRNITPFGGWVK